MHQARIGVVARVGGVEPVDVGQQHEQVGARQDRHLRRQEVVVAEGDLIGGGGVVLVDDRHHPPVEQLAQGLARVEVVGAGAHVHEREQHLGGDQLALAQQLVIGAIQLALPNRTGGLQLLDRHPGAQAGP